MTKNRTIPTVFTLAVVGVLAASTANAAPTVDAVRAAAAPATSDTIVINELQPGSDGFVELRNLTDQTIELDTAGTGLAICGSTGFPVDAGPFDDGSEIPANGFFLIVGPNWSGGTGSPDMTHPATIPADGGWLFDGGFPDIDSVGLGDNGCVEGTGTEPWAPQCNWLFGEAASRDANGTDTDQNSADFTCQTATPGS